MIAEGNGKVSTAAWDHRMRVMALQAAERLRHRLFV
jgi:hypothetical protein